MIKRSWSINSVVCLHFKTKALQEEKFSLFVAHVVVVVVVW